MVGGGPGHAPMYHQLSMPNALAARIAHQREDQCSPEIELIARMLGGMVSGRCSAHSIATCA